MNFLSDLLNLFFPDLCPSCRNRLVANEKIICLTCLNNIPKTGYHNISNNKLEDFFAGRFPFARITSFAHFTQDGAIQALIHALKYNNKPLVGKYIGQLCGKEIAGSPFIQDIDYLVPVPLHPKREKERGYNQSQKIAEGISQETGVAVSTDVLVRTQNNVSQTKRTKFERWSNTDNIFDVNNPALFEGKHILLIDDIITTGSTIESCAKTMLNNCHKLKISIFCVGSVE